MALFSNKTAIESILGNLEKKHVDMIYKAAAETLIQHSDFRNQHFAYALDPSKKKKLNELGIELYPNGYVPHSHPFSKILENHLLFDVLPNIINNSKVIMCSIKDRKVEVLKDRTSKPDNISFVNRLISGKDVGRYPEAASNFYSVNRLKPEIFSNNFFHALKGKECVFFHDEVHHWTQGQMFKFLQRTGVKRLIFTVVYPPELLSGYANSQNPKLYDFKIRKEKMFFFPDGVMSEGYEQQRNLDWLFKASHFRSGDVSWTVTRHKSVYAHHLFEVTLGDLVTDTVLFFNDFSTVNMSKMFLNRFRSYDVFPVQLNHLYKVYSYLLCLKKPDLQSGLAKLRQIIGDDVEVREFLFFEQFCKRVIERSTSWNLFGYSLFEKITEITLNAMPNAVGRMFKTWEKKNTFEFLFSLGTLVVEVERKVVFEHINEEIISIIIGTDERALLDPMTFFMANENFNEDRVDDGYIERLRIHGWNVKDHMSRPWKMNKYDYLSMTLNKERWDREVAEGPEYIKMISWKTPGPFRKPDDIVGVSDPSEAKMTMYEMITGKKDNYLDRKAAARSLENLLKFFCISGDSACLSSEQFVELLEFDYNEINKGSWNSFDNNPHLDYSCLSKLADDEDVSDKGSENQNTEILISEILDQVLDKDESDGDVSSAQYCDAKHESHEGLENSEIAQKGDGGGESFDYRKCFKQYEGPLNLTDFISIDVKADGNCFFSAVLMQFEFVVRDHAALRCEFADRLIKHKDRSLSNLALKIRKDGVYMEHELILLFAEIFKCQIVIFEKEHKTFILGDSGPIGYLEKEGEHFKSLELKKKKEEYVENLFKDEYFGVESGYDDRLEGYMFEEKNFNCFKWKGRRSAFCTNVDADYGHNGMLYPCNEWLSDFDDIIDICTEKLGCEKPAFNSVLLNFYDDNSHLPMHSDNESVYNDDQILTVGLVGSCIFRFERKGDKEIRDFKMMPGSFFIMPKGFQKEHRHGVITTEKRVSLTFRRHIRRLNGTPVVDKTEFERGEIKNMCLINAVAECTNKKATKILSKLMAMDSFYWGNFINGQSGGTVRDCEKMASDLSIRINLIHEGRIIVIGSGSEIQIKLEDRHFSMHKETTMMERTFLSGTRHKDHTNITDGLKEYLQCISKGFNEVNFVAVREYARTLAKSFMAMTTGVCCSEVMDGGRELFRHALEDGPENVGTCVWTICGFAGSGKSNLLQNWLRERKFGNFCVISPRANLSMDWQLKLNLEPKRKRKVTTFEKFIKTDKSKFDLLIFDEMTLFPNGYLDNLIIEMESVNPSCKIICLFDPLQARYHNKSDEDILTFRHEVDRMIDGQNLNYLYYSFRLCKSFEKKIDLPCLNEKCDNEDDDQMWIFPDVYSIKEKSIERGSVCNVLLVESNLEKSSYSSCINTMTFGESQGLTFDHVCIMLSESSANSNEFRWMVAITRARKRISFVCNFLGGIENFLIKKNGGLIEKLLSGTIITRDYIRGMTTCDLNLIEPDIGGADEMDREERLEGDPFLKPYIFLGQRINNGQIELEEIEVEEPVCQTHLFISEPNFAMCYNSDLIRAKEEREYREDMMVTNQFCDSYDKDHPKAVKSTCGPLRFKAIYPKHSADDDLTFWMAVRKRLVFREREENLQRLEKAHLIGGILYQHFKKTLNLEFRFDQGLLERCTNEFEVKKLAKSCGIIKSHCTRSDIDWPLNDVFLFMKSQLCTKYEKQFVDAKAGQTLACFQHLVLVNFAPWCRYLETQIREQLPEEIYIHSNKNFDDLNRWVKRFFCRDICVESDYEAFDASQDEYILSFEIHLMNDAGFPQEVIDSYINLKCDLGCKLGHFAVMRFTGEFCTFLFNTLANMAFTFCRYEWRLGQPIAFAGDDMCAFNNLSLRHDFDDIFDRLSLKAKVERTESPMFCGWRLTPYGIVKEPELVYNRFQVAIEEGKVEDCLENYAIEVSYAYSLSERLFEVLKSERQVQYHQAVVRFIVTHIDKLKTSVKNLYLEQSSDEDI